MNGNQQIALTSLFNYMIIFMVVFMVMRVMDKALEPPKEKPVKMLRYGKVPPVYEPVYQSSERSRFSTRELPERDSQSLDDKREACMREIAGWYGKHRKEMTIRSLHPIIRRYFTTEQEVKEFVDFLKSPEGREAMRKELRLEVWRRGLAGPPHHSNDEEAFEIA